MERVVFSMLALGVISAWLGMLAWFVLERKEAFGITPKDVCAYVLALVSFVCGGAVIVRLIMFTFS